jgi:hypothetical protein
VSQDKEAFLDRWSRLKEEKAKEEAKPVEKKDESPPPVLPPIEQLKPDSDFRPFMDPRVDGETRRAALKKLFAGDPHFNLPDPYEAYSGDYTVGEPIPKEMLKTLDHARHLLFEEEKPPVETAKETVPEKPAAEAKDVPGKQDA